MALVPLPPKFHLALGASFALLVVGLAWDLAPTRNLLPLPLSPVLFLASLIYVGLRGRRALTDAHGEAEGKAAALNESLSQTLADMQQAAEAYGRFVPDQFLRHLNRGSISEIRLGDQVAETVTVLFSDIRNFTTLSEHLSPEENFRFLNAFLGRIGPVIRENYGFIDKYIGDAVMALFDGPVDEAISAAVAMQLAAGAYNAEAAARGQAPLTIGIGLHSGPVMMGIIGEEGRMESTVIGDTVNLASRIESLTKHYDCRILVSRPTFEAQTDPQPYPTRPVDLVKVKGKAKSTELLELLDERYDPRAALKIDLSARLAEAMMAYRRGDFREAQGLFQILSYRDPEDNLYAIYRQRVEQYLRLGAPEGWDGTTVFDVK